MDLHLKDKIALVTGSSRGLGYATALQLAKEGCKVAINGRDEAKVKSAVEKINRETGTQACSFTCLQVYVFTCLLLFPVIFFQHQSCFRSFDALHGANFLDQII